MLAKRLNTYPNWNTLFEDVFPEMMINNNIRKFTPVNDILETDDEYRIDLILPGFNKDDFNISTEKQVLTIEGVRTLNEEDKYSIRQSYFGEFKKSYTLPNDVSIDKIDAEYVNGILNITIPKSKKKNKNRSIVIR